MPPEPTQYGPFTCAQIAMTAGRNVQVVRRDIKENRLDPENLLDLALYIVSHRLRGTFREIATGLTLSTETAKVPSLPKPSEAVPVTPTLEVPQFSHPTIHEAKPKSSFGQSKKGVWS